MATAAKSTPHKKEPHISVVRDPLRAKARLDSNSKRIKSLNASLRLKVANLLASEGIDVTTDDNNIHNMVASLGEIKENAEDDESWIAKLHPDPNSAERIILEDSIANGKRCAAHNGRRFACR